MLQYMCMICDIVPIFTRDSIDSLLIHTYFCLLLSVSCGSYYLLDIHRTSTQSMNCFIHLAMYTNSKQQTQGHTNKQESFMGSESGPPTQVKDYSIALIIIG